MATIIINNNSFTLSHFTRNTTFAEDTIRSYAYCGINYDENVENLYELASNPITSIAIKNNSNETIYELDDLNAKITNIDESYNGEAITANVNIVIQD